MYYYLIGKMETSNRKYEAYKLYDSRTETTRMITHEDLLEALEENKIKVAGISFYYGVRVTRSDINTDRHMRCSKKFPISRLDSLDGKGVSKEPRAYVLIGQKGFLESKEYICVDANAKKHYLNENEFRTKLKRKEIIGACEKLGAIVIHNLCKHQQYD